MNCPNDNTELRITDRLGIEIDYCPRCRGVWLDRGELDKLIERNATLSVRDDRDDRRAYERDRDRDRYDRSDDDDDRYPSRKSKRRSLLDDLFDFG